MMGGKAEGAEDPLVAAKNIIFTLIVLAALLWMADLLLGIDTSASTTSINMNAYATSHGHCVVDGTEFSAPPSVSTDQGCLNVGYTGTSVTFRAAGTGTGTGTGTGASGGLLSGIQEAETLASQVVGSILFILKIVVTVAAIAVIGVLRVRTY